jgi:hypothetical protein
MDWRKNLRPLLASAAAVNCSAMPENIRLAFAHAPELHDLLRFNELTLRIELTARAAVGTVRESCRACGRMSMIAGRCAGYRDTTSGARSEPAHRTTLRISMRLLDAYHPVRDYLRSLPAWDGEPRIAEVLRARCSRRRATGGTWARSLPTLPHLRRPRA